MSYYEPYVDESGYHYPTYQDILDDIVTRFQEIYGDGIYLGSDSQDYEIISIFALKIYHAYQAVELAYNSHSPATAMGTALDYVVALNGLKRNQGTKSKAEVTLTGAVGTVITNGIVSDVEGRLWDLPESVTLDSNGTAVVEAVCRELGKVTAEVGAISRIMTPTLGWYSVTNTLAAEAGKYTESDSSLRARQVTSVAMPSHTILAGLRGALLSLENVTDVVILENDTDETQADTDLPPHSICCIVDCATDSALYATIAKTILMYKSCGCATYCVSGSSYAVSLEVTDDITGFTYTINWQRVQKRRTNVQITIQHGSGDYSDAYIPKIQTAVVDYINSLPTGCTLTRSMISAIAMQANEDMSNPAFVITSVKLSKGTNTVGDNDLSYVFYEKPSGSTEHTEIIDSTGA